MNQGYFIESVLLNQIRYFTLRSNAHVLERKKIRNYSSVMSSDLTQLKPSYGAQPRSKQYPILYLLV